MEEKGEAGGQKTSLGVSRWVEVDDGRGKWESWLAALADKEKRIALLYVELLLYSPERGESVPGREMQYGV